MSPHRLSPRDGYARNALLRANPGPQSASGYRQQPVPEGAGVDRADVCDEVWLAVRASRRSGRERLQRPRDIKPMIPDAPKILHRNVYGWFERHARGVMRWRTARLRCRNGLSPMWKPLTLCRHLAIVHSFAIFWLSPSLFHGDNSRLNNVSVEETESPATRKKNLG